MGYRTWSKTCDVFSFMTEPALPDIESVDCVII